MAMQPPSGRHSRCLNCGFEAPGGDDAWVRLEVPGLGRMTQCPECESTNVMTGR
ncbi:hypothetical protein [Natronosalvus caseinilyticus]|uniref:hypothetical protein n=1 Tax=Natronosalvus caseinilyticus TaxID=2953747 RepID=UPI0028AADA85|nr:hypothetical protein [Natronosalvus caseinilyticus]